MAVRPAARSADPRPRPDEGGSIARLGSRVREARQRRGVSVRELARLVECSPSMVSQIERGRVNPSVSTLYEISTALEISLDALFTDGPGSAPSATAQERGGETTSDATTRASAAGGAVPGHQEPAANGLRKPSAPRASPLAEEGMTLLRRADRRAIELAHGVRWELLMPVPERSAEFMEVFYAPGGGSTSREHAIRHNGREYSVITQGVLSVQLGFERYELEAGDSMVFDSTIPHRYWNAGAEVVRGIWFVLDRWQVSDPGWEEQLRPHP